MLAVSLTVIAFLFAIVVSYRYGTGTLRFVEFDSDPRRALFGYYTGRSENGKRVYKKVDPLNPLRYWRTDEEFDEYEHLREYQETKNVALSALICRAVERAFGVSEFDPETGQGLTESELVSLAFTFHHWVKKNESFILILPERAQLMEQMYPSSTPKTTSDSLAFPLTESRQKTSKKPDIAKPLSMA